MNNTDFLKLAGQYKESIEKQLLLFTRYKNPSTIYKPVQYFLSAGGKRLRAILVLVSCEAVGGRSDSALNAAVAIELFHNFTLVHDDIMDHSPLRRNKPTLHKRWDVNVALLAGDALAAIAYNALLQCKSKNLREIVSVFTDAYLRVCEGQAEDKDFENRTNISTADYMRMIGKKTGNLISAAVHIGALIGNGGKNEISALQMYGQYLGKAFQIKDDLLDVTGEERSLGKTIGGDIREGKKTYLILKAFERANSKDRALLLSIISNRKVSKQIVRCVYDIYKKYDVINDAEKQVSRCTDLSRRAVAPLKSSRAKNMLLWFSNQLRERKS